MSGTIRVRSTVFAAFLVLLFTGMSFGQKGSQDPCGGHYVGEGLKALFWPGYYDLDPQDPDSSPMWFSSIILNDIEGIPYQYQVPEGDCVFLFRRGHVIVDVNRPEKTDGTDEDRYVQMNLVLKSTSEYCENTPDTLRMAHVHTVSLRFGTEKEWHASRENGELILSCKKFGWNYFNFAALTPGHTYYTQISFKFMVFGNPDEYRFDTQAKVYYGILEETGTLGWAITPIHEPYVVRFIETKGKRIVNIEDTPHGPSVYNDIGFPESNCTPGQGIYEMPFKLILQRLN